MENALVRIRAKQDAGLLNYQLSSLFQKVLRSSDMRFNYSDMVNEAHSEHINSLLSQIRSGYVFHVSLEESAGNVDFSSVKLRIPKAKLDEIEAISEMIFEIKQGIDAAYSINMRMVGLALLLYAHIKLAARS